MKEQLIQRLEGVFSPVHLDVIDESMLHGKPEGTESHFRIVVVSRLFAGRSLLEQQRAVYQALQAEMPQIHALSVTTMDVARWSEMGASLVMDSPACRGGSKHG